MEASTLTSSSITRVKEAVFLVAFGYEQVSLSVCKHKNVFESFVGVLKSKICKI